MEAVLGQGRGGISQPGVVDAQVRHLLQQRFDLWCCLRSLSTQQAPKPSGREENPQHYGSNRGAQKKGSQNMSCVRV